MTDEFKFMKYNKLVRDKIPEIIKQRGDTPVTHIADEAEYWLKLKAKFQEELNEFLEAENIEELADIYEVIDAICEYKNYNKNEILQVQSDKAAKRGKFKARIILDES